MKSLFIIVTLVISLLFALCEGNTYAVAMLGLEIQTGSTSTASYEVVLINPNSAQITVNRETIDINGSPQQISIAAGSKEKYTFSQDKVMNGSEFANKTAIFKSSDDFILQIFSTDVHTEGLLGIPIEDLKGPNQIDNVYEYIVTTFCATSGYCQLAVTSDRQVDVMVTLPGNVNDVVFCIGMRYYRSWRDQLITLEKFDAIQIESTRDLTGTHIYSMGVPIVVYVGTRNVTNGVSNSHMLEQLTPFSHWGTKFGVTSLGQSGYGDIIKIAANWPSTEIRMQGFPSFVISNRSHVVSRRIDKGMTTYIEATHPIQVVQIIGLNYATTDSNGSLAMTTVPAVEHGTNSPIIVSCGPSATAAHFTLLTIFVSHQWVDNRKPMWDEQLEARRGCCGSTGVRNTRNPWLGKGSGQPVVEGNTLSSSSPIMYWDQNIFSYDQSAEQIFNVTGDRVFGIVQCDDKATFPLATKHLYNLTVEEETVVTEDTCIEGETAWSPFDYYQLPNPADRNLDGMEVLKLRAKVCGEAVVQFDQGSNSIIVRLTESQTIVDLCHDDDCEHHQMRVDNFNSNLDCRYDMAVYWFRQIKVNKTTIRFCFGTGPIHDRTDECAGGNTFTTLFTTDDSLFTKFSVVGLHSDAFFLMDLEPASGCSVHVSDWRCEDKLTNCSAYGISECNNGAHTGFRDACQKHCGVCEVDSYGEKFLVPFPAINPSTDLSVIDYACYIYVTVKSSSLSSHVSVTKQTSVITATNMTDNRTFVYDCSDDKDELVTIRSSEDVAVTVVYWMNDKVVTHNVYPVDAYGTNHMTFSHDDSFTPLCNLVSEDVDVSVVPYFSTNIVEVGGTQIQDGIAFSLNDFEVNQLKLPPPASNSEVMLKSNKPIGVFCGNIIDRNEASYPDHYNQIFPTDIWGTQYHIPSFGTDMVNRPFKGELKIQAYMANTFVSIEGDFTSNYSLIAIGDMETVTTNLGHKYVVQSNYPVAVAISLIDSADNSDQFTSFHIVPPTNSFGSNNLIFAPLKVISEQFAGFGVLSYAAVNTIAADGQETRRPIVNLTENFYTDVAAGSQFGMTTVVSAGSKWFAIPMYTSAVPLINTVSVCIISTPVLNDNKDNDCDLLIDESVCSLGYGVIGQDVDVDGDFYDDCGVILTEPVVETIGAEPVCLVIDRPPDQCWTVCECKCSWVENYNLMQNLTADEFNNLQANKSAAIQQELEIETDDLSSSTAQFESANDERQSAANIGYVGIALFTIVFGTIFIMDLTALWRDLRTFARNWSIGCKRLWNFILRRP